ncbi:hypothetical protein A2480_02525 [Candidatus Uhrbacteria bacterium RIFOXYC2_FULL_47_19]|uniref:Baseplate protein J-like domain-containing protein n=1 Tax=Candidatus Uhrbacteria bacterium RIFOXYC2_FULL_47_19 TaxID=1802424 RepID=A0A1F7WFD6_9BACT|nr:MAG: hypothetical protein A2480_02525 [Candidatus Uhrbacteria bacterium RIFOXYC2_FULL_47_19]
MEEALRDLDKMMAEEDSVYRLGSETKIERDYGMGMGKMLETIDETIENNVSESQEKVDETMSSAEDQRLSIESILGDSDTSNEDVERVPNRLITPHRSRGSKLLLFIPVLVFVLALLLVAEGVGLFGGVGRRWTSEVLSIISSKFGQSSVQETSQPTERPSFPSVVSINVLVMAGGSEVETIFSSVMSRMIETDVQLQDTFKATGEAFSDDAKSIGVITVVNGTSRDFRFVATTRFLSEDGILFRLKEATDIPANDSVDVSVYADIAGSTGDIGPSRFTIPGLSQELQADIYGISDSLMTGGSGTVVAVSAEDITAAKEDLLDRLRVEAIDNFSLMVDEGERIAGDLITSQELEVMEPEVGTPGATFSLEVSAEFKTLVVPEKEIISLLQARMEELLLDDSDSSSFEVSEPLYAVEAYDTIGERAELRAESSVRPL